MTGSFLTKIFSAPKYPSTPLAGVDISDRSVKFIRLKPTGRQRLAVKDFGEKTVPLGVMSGGVIKQPETLIALLAELKNEHGLTAVNALLPEEKAQTIRFSLPAVEPEELERLVESQLEEYLPWPVDQAIVDYDVIKRPAWPQDTYRLAVSALPRKAVDEYAQVFHQAGLRPLGFEAEARAVKRALVPQGDRGTYLIVDLGRTRTSLSVASQGSTLYAATVENLGGDMLTAAIQKILGLNYPEAEAIKAERGLLGAAKNRELHFALVSNLAVWRDEILRHFKSWQTHRDEVGQYPAPIEKIILTGGQAALPGLIDYFRVGFPAPVAIGNPWTNVLSTAEEVPPITADQALRYAPAIGLALRHFLQV